MHSKKHVEVHDDIGKSHADNESETTIYHNAVPKFNDCQDQQEVNELNVNVDREISFKLRQNRDSSSSEERIDTSDEMMDIENNLCDPHSSFIAECEAQAKKA